MLRPSISVWGLTETALQTTVEGGEILVASGLRQWLLNCLSDVAAVVRVKVEQCWVGAREEQVNELIKEAEEAIGERLEMGERRRLLSWDETQPKVTTTQTQWIARTNHTNHWSSLIVVIFYPFSSCSLLRLWMGKNGFQIEESDYSQGKGTTWLW